MRGRHPILRFRNGSRITYRTAMQGGLALSGGTFDHVLIDELVERRIYNELRKRVERRNGTVRLTLTPINAPADWLREECEAGRVVDLHYRCEARYCVPIGDDVPLVDAKTGLPMDQAWIDRFVAATDPHEVEVVVHGGWQIVHVDRSFAAWSEDLVGTDPLPAPADLAVGIDYGEDPGRWVILLLMLGVDDVVYCLGEWSGTGRETPRDAVVGVEAMLSAWGLTAAQIPRWVGDVNSAGPLSGGRSMNEIMEAELRRSAPRLTMSTAWKPRGSVDARFSVLNSAMARRKIRVHGSCRRLLEAFRGHRRGKQAARLKDPVDALWYAAETWLRETVPVPARVRWG
jgi:hypothetical protein